MASMQLTLNLFCSGAYCVANERSLKKESATSMWRQSALRSEWRSAGQAMARRSRGGEPVVTCTLTVLSDSLVRRGERSKLAAGRFHQLGTGGHDEGNISFLGFRGPCAWDVHFCQLRIR